MSAQSATGGATPEEVDRLLADIEGVDTRAFEAMMHERMARWFALPVYLLESPPVSTSWIAERGLAMTWWWPR